MSAPRVAILALLLAAATLAAYWRVRGFEFVNYDDVGYVSANQRIQQGLTLDNIAWAVTANDLANWHPVTWFSHMFDCSVFGSDAGLHHLENAFWHTANSVILFLVLGMMTGAIWRSWLVAALFALHPLHVESVAWVAERKDVLSAFFGLLAVGTYALWVRRRQHRWFALSLLCFALGLMTKPMLVTLPCVLLLLDYWPLDRLVLLDSPLPPAPRKLVKREGSKRRPETPVIPPPMPMTPAALVIEKLPFFALAIASSVITYLAQKQGGALEAIERTTLDTRMANAVIAYAKYMTQAIWPSRMAVLYPYLPLNPVELFASAAVLVVVTFAAIVVARRSPPVIVGWLLFLGMLVPVIGIVQVGEQSRADRYTYLPLIGLFIIVAWMIPRPRVATPAALGLRVAPVVAILAALWMVTVKQLDYWHDSVTLYTHAINVTSDNPVMHCNLGAALMQRNDRTASMEEFRKALALRPWYVNAKRNLGRVLIGAGQNDEGVQLLEELLRTQPNDVECMSDLGVGYLQQGKVDQALIQFKKAADLDPSSYLPRLNLGSTYFTQRRFADALPWLEQALRLEPREGQAHYFMGATLLGLNRAEEALPHLQEAVNTYPVIDARMNLANCLLAFNKPDEAIEQYQKVLQQKPEFVQARGNLSLALARAGRYEQAIAETRTVIQLTPNSPAGYAKLAELLVTAPDPKLRNPAEAVQLAQKACDLTGRRDPDMLGMLAQTQAASGAFADAITTAQSALAIARARQATALSAELERRIAMYQSGRAE